MCLYPKLIHNKKYQPNKKNGWQAPPVHDKRLLLVPIGCQKCIECRKQKAREWQVRLSEEVRNDSKGYFVTLTFSNENYTKLYEKVLKEDDTIETAYELDNKIATQAVRYFFENLRKKTGKSAKHWLITELGHNGTENIHLHGIIWLTDPSLITSTWKNGYAYIGYSLNESVVNYMTKYVLKPDTQHESFKPKILTSKKIGQGYEKRLGGKMNGYRKNGETDETYTTRTGIKLPLPIYYRNKIYTEEQREKLWIEKLEKQERYVLGTKIDTSNGIEAYQKQLKVAQAKNKRMGFGDGKRDWEQEEYENRLRWLKQQQRLK